MYRLEVLICICYNIKVIANVQKILELMQYIFNSIHMNHDKSILSSSKYYSFVIMHLFHLRFYYLKHASKSWELRFSVASSFRIWWCTRHPSAALRWSFYIFRLKRSHRLNLVSKRGWWNIVMEFRDKNSNTTTGEWAGVL